MADFAQARFEAKRADNIELVGTRSHLCYGQIRELVTEIDRLSHATPTPPREPEREAKLDTYRFAEIHPDAEIAREVVIDYLLGALCEAQRALSSAAQLRVATPEGITLRRNLMDAGENAAKALAWRGPGAERFSSDSHGIAPASAQPVAWAEEVARLEAAVRESPMLLGDESDMVLSCAYDDLRSAAKGLLRQLEARTPAAAPGLDGGAE